MVRKMVQFRLGRRGFHPITLRGRPVCSRLLRKPCSSTGPFFASAAAAVTGAAVVVPVAVVPVVVVGGVAGVDGTGGGAEPDAGAGADAPVLPGVEPGGGAGGGGSMALLSDVMQRHGKATAGEKKWPPVPREGRAVTGTRSGGNTVAAAKPGCTLIGDLHWCLGVVCRRTSTRSTDHY